MFVGGGEQINENKRKLTTLYVRLNLKNRGKQKMTKETKLEKEREKECYEYLAIGVKRLETARTETEVDSLIEHIEFWSKELRGGEIE